MKTSRKIIIGGLGAVLGSSIAGHVLKTYKEVSVPIGSIVKEAEEFDKNPKDNKLSVQESEELLKTLVDKNKDGRIDKDEMLKAKEIRDAFAWTYGKEARETTLNLEKALDFILTRQKINNPEGDDPVSLKSPLNKEMLYSDFLKIILNEKEPLVKKIIFKNRTDNLIAILKNGSEYLVRIPQDSGVQKDLAEKVLSKNIEIEAQSYSESNLLGMLVLFAPLILIILLIAAMSRQGGIFSIGKTKAKLQKGSDTKFDHVAGIDEVKQELHEIVDFLKNPNKYEKLGGTVPKGVLLIGPPGTGKTLIARAVAGEAGVLFFSESGSGFVEMIVGVGASRVRDLFKKAKDNAPCILFIDELDAIGGSRGKGISIGGHDEREQTLDQLLVEMDGFEATKGVIVLAATNRPDVLDNALLRPGRFDRQIAIDKPDVKGREEILKVHAQNKPLADNVDLKVIAKRTPGFTGADLANVLNEAALLAARNGKDRIYMENMEEAIDRVIAGLEKKSRVISQKDKNVVAYHEAGHALVAHLEKKADPLHKITIIPRGMALGITMTLPEEDKVNISKSELTSMLKVLLGGRASEEVVFSDITTGAQNDLERVTDLVTKMITKFGMSEKLGQLTFGESNENPILGDKTKGYSEAIAFEIDSEKRTMIDKLYDEVKTLLKDKRHILDAVAKALLEKETIDKEEFIKIVNEAEKTITSKSKVI